MGLINFVSVLFFGRVTSNCVAILATSLENLSSGISDQVRLQPAFSVTDASKSDEIANIETRDIILSRQ